MYNPCFECYNRYGGGYNEECDTMCEYAHAINKLKQYGGLEEVLKVLNGDSLPLVFLDKDHIERTYHIVCAVKDGII